MREHVPPKMFPGAAERFLEILESGGMNTGALSALGREFWARFFVREASPSFAGLSDDLVEKVIIEDPPTTWSGWAVAIFCEGEEYRIDPLGWHHFLKIEQMLRESP